MALESLAPICFSCKNFRGIIPGIGYTCEAFGKDTQIPIEIIVSSADHHKPYKGDNGILFEKDEPEGRAASVALVTADGKVLLLRRSVSEDNWPGHWALPGGKADDGEDFEECARREMQEEIGDCNYDNLMEMQRTRTPNNFEHTTFIAPVEEPFTPKLNKEHDKWDWVSVHELPEMIHPGVKKALDTIALALDPPESEAQRKAMFAAAAGHSTLGIPEKVGEEYVHSDPGGKLPKKARDMTGENWKMLRWLLGKFFTEESQEEEHKEPAGDGHILTDDETNDECVQQIRNLFGEFRKGKVQRDAKGKPEDTAKDVASFEEIRDAVASKSSDPDALAAWIKDRTDPGWRSARANDRALAHDESPWTPKIAADKEPQRTIDSSGHMHVKDTVLTKAVVSPYLGEEINQVMKDEPGWKTLEPEKTYHLLRDPKELKKGLESFNGKPLLWVHRGVDANDHPANLVIGSTGTNAHLGDDDELTNDLVIWPKYATEAIEDGEKKSLSCGYAYKADMTPGSYKGHNYDGIMRDISGNHVALVDKPRVPGAKVGGDEMYKDAWDLIAAALLAA